MKLDLLVFAAHPDDAELGCGATMIKCVEAGKKVGVIDLTEGELSTRGDVETRRKEAQQASEIIGLTIRENLGFHDGWFKNDDEHKLKIISKVRQYQPDIVIANAPGDRHPDHGRGASLVKEATWMAGLAKVETNDAGGNPQKQWRPRRFFQYIQFLPFEPDFIVDANGYLDKKMAAVMAFKSQFFNPESKEGDTIIAKPEFLELVRSRLLSHGNYALIEYGEGFLSDFKPAVSSPFDLL